MVRSPSLAGRIDRRLLVNFTMDADVAARYLPDRFEPQLVEGRAVVGICLIRLAQLRPRRLPGRFGLHSENAAHRFAVLDRYDPGGAAGVYIPRRDTNSVLTTLVGGRLYPGVHHRASFVTSAADDRHRVAFTSRDGSTTVEVAGRIAEGLPDTSVFGSVEASSAFFADGARGWSATARPGRFDGLELRTVGWSVRPFHVDDVRSSFFEDIEVFPAGSVRFDHALVMTDVEHSWRPLARVDEPVARRR